MVKLTMDSRAKVLYRADDLQQLLVLIRTAVQNFKRHQPMVDVSTCVDTRIDRKN